MYKFRMATDDTPEALLREIIKLDPDVASEMDGDISCFFCSAWLGYRPPQHETTCLYIRAKKLCEAMPTE